MAGSRHDAATRERIAQALAEEYAYLGVRLSVARECVAEGQWDDHPAAGRARAAAPTVRDAGEVGRG